MYDYENGFGPTPRREKILTMACKVCALTIAYGSFLFLGGLVLFCFIAWAMGFPT